MRGLIALLVPLLALGAVPAATPAAPCAALEAVTAAGTTLCTHGHDVQPASSRVDGDAPGAAVPTTAPACEGDGTAGLRIQVLAVHAAGAAAPDAALLRHFAGQVEWTFTTSAARDGAIRHLRWVTEEDPAGGCRVAVSDVAVARAALDDFGDTIDAVAAQGYDHRDRKYLMVADIDVGLCGIATSPVDDQASDRNLANHLVGYARVDRDCWGMGDEGYYSVPAHEIAHMLGAVQEGAPHGTPGHHCTDGHDLLCYDDGGGETSVRCADDDPATEGAGDRHHRLLDCHGDDYFNASRSVGGWLGSHWNVARSQYLLDRRGQGRGFPDPATAVADPRGRPLAFDTIATPHRPLLREGIGWEACDLPVTVTVAARQGGVLGSIAPVVTDSRDEATLRASVRAAVDAINGQVGLEVVRYVVATRADGIAFEAVAVAGAPGSVVPTRVEVGVRDARISRAAVGVAVAAAGEQLDTWTRQSLVQALGLGRDGLADGILSTWPADATALDRAARALMHLYDDGACQEDRRLRDTAGGDYSQRRPGGAREQLDLAAGAGTSQQVGLAAAAWLRGELGDHWAQRLVVCRDDVHADCLAGAALAGASGPVLFVPGGPTGVLPATVRDEVRASIAKAGTVYVLGGRASVSWAIERDLAASVPSGARVVRLAGGDRYATAAAVSSEVVRVNPAPTGSQVALVAAGRDPIDAVAAGAYAAATGTPVVLAEREVLPTATATFLAAHDGPVTVVGGTAMVADAVVRTLAASGHAMSRASGRDRFATSVALAESDMLWARRSIDGTSGAVIAVNGRSPLSWALALAAAPVAARLHAPVLYVEHADIPPVVDDYLTGMRLTSSPRALSIVMGVGPHVAPVTAARFHAHWLPAFDANLQIEAS